MTDCQSCGGKTAGPNLCGRCTTDLRDTLTLLARRTAVNVTTGEHRPAPGFLELLEDAALGFTRLGESARRSTEHSTPLPVNLNASALYDDIHAMLQRWTQAINVSHETLTAAGKDA